MPASWPLWTPTQAFAQQNTRCRSNPVTRDGVQKKHHFSRNEEKKKKKPTTYLHGVRLVLVSMAQRKQGPIYLFMKSSILRLKSMHFGASGWLSRLSDFGSGHDLPAREFKPASGSVLTARSLEPVSDSGSPLLSAPPPLTLCLSQKKKIKKNFLNSNNLALS